MIRFILETIAFQLSFLLIYDLFLKKETFFQWNRLYLLGTFLLSLALPLIQIDALKTTVSQKGVFYPEFLVELEGVQLSPSTAEMGLLELISVSQLVYLLGIIFMSIWFASKMNRILLLKRNGIVIYGKDYSLVQIKGSKAAFSFFKNVFLGDAIPKEKEPQILAHELVHIRQWHSLDLLFFEILRIVLWFNPMVYLFQNRIAELHEFIADSKATKEDKMGQYQLLLSQVFQTQHLSFINQFYKKSLIKKRIVMLTKEKSKAVHQLKYLGLLPLILGMLVYSSCEAENETASQFTSNVKVEGNLITFSVYDLNNLSEAEKDEQSKVFGFIEGNEKTVALRITDSFKNTMEVTYTNGVIDNVQVNKEGKGEAVPFGVINEVPIFPGCEDAADTKACFMEHMQTHIRKHFNYPEEAQNLGIEGRVSVMFTIDLDGTITNIRKRGPHELLENEVERIINRLPKMQPGIHNGKPVKVPFSIPVIFKLK